MDWVQAAAIPETYFTVWANLFDLGGASRPAALIQGGTSGIGTTASCCAASSASRHSPPRAARKVCGDPSMGAEAINYRDQDFVQVIQENRRPGVNVVLDIMGGSYLNQNIAALGMDGRW
jgi:NADPH:quinone reductase-like Zn-dependent oxidoreductase